MSFPDCLSSVCPSVFQSVCPTVNLFHIFIVFSRTTVSIQTNSAQSILWDSSLFKRKATLVFKTGDNYEKLKKHWRNLKIFFSRTAEPISTQLSINHPWVKGIQVCSNEGSQPFRRGKYYEIVKLHWRNLIFFFFFSKREVLRNSKNTLTKFVFSSQDPLGQFQTKLAQIILGWWEIKIDQM